MPPLLLRLLQGVVERSKFPAEVIMMVSIPRICSVIQQGKVVSMGKKMKETVKGYFCKSNTQESAQEDQVSKTPRWFKFNVCLILFLVFTTGPKGVRSENVGNPLTPGSAAMDSLLANENLRGFKLVERRQLVGAEAAAMTDDFNYNDFPRGNPRPKNEGRKQANPKQRNCNPAEYCRQGNKGKKN